MEKKTNNEINRCFWANTNNPLYIAYHDEEWGVPCHDERMLFEMLILEGFQAGLSWECVLNKREAFREAYDNFNVQKVVKYDENKILELTANPKIIRNRLKVNASIINAQAFIKIQEEYGSFDKYIWGFTEGNVIYEPCDLRTTSPLSDTISKDLKKRGMKFVGSTIIYSYLQAIGIINGHLEGCWKYKKQFTFRNATVDDAHFIARGFHMAMLYDDASEEQISKFAQNICIREDVLYSWRNTIIAEFDNKCAGMLTAYDGRYYHEMRIKTMSLVKQHLGVEFPGMEDEAVAGEYYLDSLAVMPEFRGRGIGRQLLEQGIKIGKSLNLNVTLAVDPINARAKKLYRSLGFNPSGTLFIFGHDYDKMIIK